MNIIAVIPARYKSSRFPGKPLADIHGKPMIWYVYNNAVRVSQFSRILVATEDDRIAQVCASLNIPYEMTRSDHATGTDRIAEIAQKMPADYYVNIQGDEPLLSVQTIKTAMQPIANKETFDVVNLMAQISDTSEVINSTIPKVVVNAQGQAIFLSRSPIPYPKKTRELFYKQVCVYTFTRDSLLWFAQTNQGPIEQAEDIEILRYIEHRKLVRMLEVKESSMAVDTAADLELVRKIIKKI